MKRLIFTLVLVITSCSYHPIFETYIPSSDFIIDSISLANDIESPLAHEWVSESYVNQNQDTVIISYFIQNKGSYNYILTITKDSIEILKFNKFRK